MDLAPEQLPKWLQWSMEQNIGEPPVWKFPKIPDSPEGLSFEKLDFLNRYQVLKMFKNDPNPYVDKRFKDPQKLYEYVGLLRIQMLYTYKRGGCDWLVRKDNDYVGLLHAFEFSKEQLGFQTRKCAIGYAFVESVRGTGLPLMAVQYFQNFLFKKMNLLFLTASVHFENQRSIRFLKKLGFEERFFEEEEEEKSGLNEIEKKVDKELYFELFRTKRSKNRVLQQRQKDEAKYRAWKASWVKNPDGTYTIPKAAPSK